MSSVLQSVIAKTVPWQGESIARELLGENFEAIRSGKLPLVLFCAGFTGRTICEFLNRQAIYPVCFCDNNPIRVGGTLCNIPIISIDALKQSYKDSLIIVASAAFQRFVEKQLLEIGFQREKIISLDADGASYDQVLRREQLMMLARNGEPNGILDELRFHEEELQAAFDLLSDEKSKALFINRLSLVVSGYDYRSYKAYLEQFSEPIITFGYDNPIRFQHSGSYFYFNNDVFEPENGEVLVDGGAYIGDSADAFVQACRQRHLSYDHIFCYEADRANFKQLRQNLLSRRDITFFNLGLWSSQTTLKFISSANTESYGARIQDQDGRERATADSQIEADSIDGTLAGQRISLIKMDIEGAEKEALAGATETIRVHTPKLAISVYHSNADLFQIPLLIHKIRPRYRLYLRHLANYFDDVVLFATI